jgi:hypothetical protein
MKDTVSLSLTINLHNMSPHEQEHWDHEAGSANEFQNSYTWSVMNLGPDGSHEARAEAERLTRAGKFVILVEDEVCCPVTDVFIRAETSIYAVCETRAEADQIVIENEDAPMWVYRLPEPKLAKPEPSVPDWDDSCPF